MRGIRAVLFLFFPLVTRVFAQEDLTGLDPPRGWEQLPESAQIRAGLDSVRQGRFREAIPPLRRAEAVNASAAVLKLLAVSYYGLHQYRLFVVTMQAASRKQPGDWAPYYYLGRHYDSDEQNFEQAARYFRLALERNPNHVRVISYLGYCLEVTRGPGAAAEYYRRAISLVEQTGARFSHPYQRLGHVKLLEEGAAAALPYARKAVELAPTEAANHKLLATVYISLGRTQEAIQAWEAAAERDPTDAAIQYRLYRAYLSASDRSKVDAALAAYHKTAALYGTK